MLSVITLPGPNKSGGYHGFMNNIPQASTHVIIHYKPRFMLLTCIVIGPEGRNSWTERLAPTLKTWFTRLYQSLGYRKVKTMYSLVLTILLIFRALLKHNRHSQRWDYIIIYAIVTDMLSASKWINVWVCWLVVTTQFPLSLNDRPRIFPYTFLCVKPGVIISSSGLVAAVFIRLWLPNMPWQWQPLICIAYTTHRTG